MIKIAIVDDHKLFIEGLVSLLSKNKDIEIVSTFEKGDDLLKFIDKSIVNIVITDISMPDVDGLQLLKKIKLKQSNIKVLALTMHNDEKTIKNMLKAGVDGYLFKDTSKNELLTALKILGSGDVYFSDEVKNSLLQGFHYGKVKKSKSLLPELLLSEREMEILKMIALEYTQQEIANQLFISTHTVVFHRRNLLQKLGAKNTAGLIKTAIEYGFLA